MRASLRFSPLLQASISCALAIVVSTGCGKPKEQPAGDAPAQTSAQSAEGTVAEIQLQTPNDAQNLLTGVWMGQAVLNEETLQTLLSQTPEDQQQALITEAKTFLSTQMAMQFDSSGVMETAIEITPDGGEPIAGNTMATWTVAGVQGNQLVLETTENTVADQPVTSQTVYTVSPNGNRIVMQTNVSSALSKCEPLIYLDRQADQPVQRMADTSANSQGGIVR